MNTSLPVTLSDVERAEERIRSIAMRTPVEQSRALGRMVGQDVFLKCENLQRAGSFKVRGAYARMSELTDDERARGVVAASAGNHAQGVAVAAKGLGIDATIYMPKGAAIPKVEATRGHGATVVLEGETVDEALLAAKRHAEETGAVFVHPFDHPLVVAGQGTVGLEVLEQVPDVETVICGVGGGGLLAGVAVAIKEKARELGREIRVIGVQAENAAAYPPSLAADALVPLERISTMADGIAVGRPGQVPFAVIRELVDDVVTVSEDALARALIFLLERTKMVVEPAGAVGVAALMEGVVRPRGPVAVVLSGGNIDPLLMLKVIQRGLFASGRFITVRIMLDDRPGSLKSISRIIADHDANVTRVDHTRIGGSISMGRVAITIDMETKGHEHTEEVFEALRLEGFEPIVQPG
ncbi:threonine ammonia-lyase [Falsarthrobacter nasiphocae]|uniref:threonine ammonia-lyase n=1 Tax=Falsarthrobacter nasiphocae TaxID=189863 RepID=A0AAE3YGB8_9MICC|nr:threonine ammonia-lyase [Falsarthrobacter nasiphocae]MDR6891650.1 threonine dehydratase [Falsarthrobacter nasiphocae]